jgi:hypothetical protein
LILPQNAHWDTEIARRAGNISQTALIQQYQELTRGPPCFAAVEFNY